MAQPTYKHTYKICPVFEHNCSNYNIQILSESTVEIPCDDPKCIEFGIEEGSPNQCIEFLVTCLDCGSCPSQYYKKCFCTTKDDCSECQDCNQLGICEDKCKTTEFCKDDTCLECDDTHPCPPDKKCVGGKCVCPAGTKKDPQGRCVQCFPTDDLGKCRICVDGVITPIPCDGVCDESNGCVDCLNSNDCSKNTDGRNCCNNKQCGCCPGYVWSFEQNKCIIPPCVDEECGPCKKCGPNGCEPVTCPPGFKCDPNVDDCVPDPCNSAPCENGADCGPECGCKGEVCTECAKLSCEECTKSLGCVCNESTNFVCAKVNKCDDNPCVTKHDCSEDCGCDKSVCQECANYSCEECGKIPGCKCVNGRCQGDGDRGCKDTFTLKPLEDCKGGLEATLTKTSSCACGDITVGIYQQPSGANFPNLNLQFRKGSGDWDSLINFNRTDSDKISDKEKDTETYTVTFKYELLTSTGVKVKESLFTRSLASIGDILNTGDISISSLTDTEILKGKKFRVTVTVQDIKITENLCIYKGKTLLQDTFDVQYTATTARPVFPDLLVEPETAWLKEYVKLESDSIRKPLFVWYRSKNSTFGNNDIVKRKYVDPKSLNTFVDSLTLDEGFLPKFDYLVTNDCSCVKSVSLDDVVICEDKDLKLDPTNCNTKVTILEDIKLCDASNKLLAPYIGKGSTKPNLTEDINYAQIKFYIAINGIEKEEFIADTSGVIALKNKVYENPSGINSIEFYVKIGDKKVCIKTQTLQTPLVDLPDPTLQCEGQLAFVFAGGTIKTIKDGINIITSSNGRFIVPVPKDGTYSLEFEMNTGCKLTKEFTINCCSSKSINLFKQGTQILDTDYLFNSSTDIVYNISTIGFTNNATLTSSHGVINQALKTLTLTPTDISSLQNNSVLRLTVSENGCEKFIEIKIVKLDFILSVSPDACTEGTLTLKGTAGSNFTILKNGTVFGQGPLVGDTWTSTTQNGSSNSTVTYTLSSYAGVDVDYRVDYTILPSPTLVSATYVLPVGTECTGNSYKYQVQGTGITANTTRIFYTINGSTVQNQLVFTENNLFYISVPTPIDDEVNIAFTKISNGSGCESMVSLGLNHTLKLPSNVSYTTPACVPSLNKYQVTLSVNDLDPGSYSFSVSPGSGYTYSNGVITFDLGFNGPVTITTIVNVSPGVTIVRCPQLVSFAIPTVCNALERMITATNLPKGCSEVNGSTRSFTFAESPIRVSISPYDTLTFTNSNTGDIKVYVVGNGIENSPSLNASLNSGILTINSFSVPSSVNVANLSLRVKIAAKGDYGAVEQTFGPISYNDKTFIISEGFDEFLDVWFVDDHQPTKVLLESVSLLDLKNGDGNLPISNGQPFIVGLRYTGANYASIPSDFTIKLFEGSSEVFTFTKADMNPSNGLQSSFYSQRLNGDGGNYIGSFRKSLMSCGSNLGFYEFQVTSMVVNPLVVYRDGNPTSYSENFCTSQTSALFTHEYSSNPSAITTWTYQRFGTPTDPTTITIATGTGDSFEFLPPSNVTLNGYQYRLYVTVTLGSAMYEKSVYITVDEPIHAVFNAESGYPATQLTQGGSVYTPPLPANHLALNGSWSPSTINPTTAGSFDITYNPTTPCTESSTYTVNVNAVIPGQPSVSGPTQGCTSVPLEVLATGAGVLKLFLISGNVIPPDNNTPPPGTINSYNITSGNVQTVTLTQGGNYTFIVHNGANYGNPTFVNGIVVTSKATITGVSLLPSYNLGDFYNLPSSIGTPPVQGHWELNNSIVTQVDTSTLGTKTYVFKPSTCHLDYTYSPSVVCPNVSPVISSDSNNIYIGNPNGFFTLIVLNVYDTLTGLTATFPVTSISSISRSNATYFPDTNTIYNVYLTANSGSCSGTSDTITNCRCSTPGCTATAQTLLSWYTDDSYLNQVDTNVSDSITIEEYIVSEENSAYGNIPYKYIKTYLHTIMDNQLGYSVTTDTAPGVRVGYKGLFYFVEIIQGSGSLDVSGNTINRLSGDTASMFVNKVNNLYPNAIYSVNNNNLFAFNILNYTTTNDNVHNWTIHYAANVSYTNSNWVGSHNKIFTSNVITYTYNNLQSYLDNVSGMETFITTTASAISFAQESPASASVIECQPPIP